MKVKILLGRKRLYRLIADGEYKAAVGYEHLIADFPEVESVKDDLHFCEWLAEHVGVGAVPGSCFFREDVRHLIRFHFAKRDETLTAALERLSELDGKAKGYKE